MILIILGVLFFGALILGPQLWVRWTFSTHATERRDYPGTGGEFAERLVSELGLKGVRVENTDHGDHYSSDS